MCFKIRLLLIHFSYVLEAESSKLSGVNFIMQFNFFSSYSHCIFIYIFNTENTTLTANYEQNLFMRGQHSEGSRAMDPVRSAPGASIALSGCSKVRQRL